ncbi:hypothetical protein Pgin04_00406 [Porphyromonas gingivalis]
MDKVPAYCAKVSKWIAVSELAVLRSINTKRKLRVIDFSFVLRCAIFER